MHLNFRSSYNTELISIKLIGITCITIVNGLEYDTC